MLGAEAFREDGLVAAGDLLDVVRLAVYWFWCRLAWQASRNVRNPVWTPLARTALATGLVVTVLT